MRGSPLVRAILVVIALLALLVPERYQQMVTRAAEFGNDRIVLGSHYAMDVLGGRTLAEYDLAQLLANKTGYVGVERDNIKIDDFPKALAAARDELTAALQRECGSNIADCGAQDQSRFADPAKNKAFYEATQTYGLPVVFANNAEGAEDVAKLAPEAGYLLTAAFPSLTLAQADAGQLARDVLQVKGYRVLIAESAEAGLPLALEKNPDLVLMDIHLPGMNGIQALAKLRFQQFPTLPIIVGGSLIVAGGAVVTFWKA